MATPDRQSLPGVLEAGYIVESNLALDDLCFSCTVEVTEVQLRRYELRFRHISNFVLDFDGGHRESGDRVQLTQMWIEATPESSPTEEWTVAISSYDLTHLRLRCAQILVDGVVLV